VFDVGENGGRGKYMLKNFFFSCRLVAAIWVGFENMMPGMKLFFFACDNKFFCSPMHTVCEILFVPVFGN
jgi:hypothetical protein